MPTFGLITFGTDVSITPQELAPALEERGFDALFYAEHTHIPTSRRTPFVVGGEMPPMYWRTHDQFVALTMAAAATSTLRIGTGVSLVTEHDPINLAKRAASLDRLSGGRLILGIGAGWNAEEMEDHGVAFEDRWKVTRERVLAMRTIWNEEEPEFHGTFVDFPPMWSWPKPLQEGGPPILMGAASKWSPARIAEYCDGWMPLAGMNDVGAGLAAIREECAKRGRSADDLDVTVLAAVTPDRGPDLEALEVAIRDGATRVALPMTDLPREEALPLLDQYTELMAKFG